MFSSLLISSWADCNVTHDYAHLKLLTCKDPTGCKLRRKKHKTWITRLTFFLSETTDICKHLFTILFYFCRSRTPCVTHLALFFFDVISERDSLTWFPSVISGPHTYSFFRHPCRGVRARSFASNCHTCVRSLLQNSQEMYLTGSYAPLIWSLTDHFLLNFTFLYLIA